MILAHSWGLLGLLAIPLILAIHLFRRRFRPRLVTGLFLYGASMRSAAAGRTRHLPRWRASLALELLAALAMTWYLSDPHRDASQQAQHLVVVLDSRWRVAASTPAGGVDASLRRQVAARIATLAGGDRVTLIASGSTPAVFCGPAARPDEALAALERWHPDQPWHELDGALTLGRSLGEATATLLVASDRVPPALPAGVGVIAAGEALATSGLIDARWYADADGRRIVAQVLAQGAACARRLELRRGAQVLAGQDLRLEDGLATTVVFPLLGGADDDVELVLAGSDPLPQDDRVTLIAPPPATVLVRLADGVAAAELAAAQRAFKAIAGVRVVADAATAVHLAYGGLGPPQAGTWRLRCVAGQARPVLGPFLTRRGHPALANIDFTGVLWTGGLPADALGAGATPLVEAGDAILVSESRRGRDRDLTLHLDPATSSLGNHPGWPAFIANLVAARRAALPGVHQPNLLPGQDLLVVLPPGQPGLTVVAPDGRSAALSADGDGVVLVPGRERPGIHRLELPGGVAWQRLAILPCDARLADLRGAQSTTIAAGGDGLGLVERQRPLLAHLLPILAAGIAALAAWRIFAREERRAP